MLRINPLELRLPSELKNEISCKVEPRNGTRNCIAFNIQLPSAQYSAQPVKCIVQPRSMYVVMITVQARDVREHDHADKLIVESMKWTEGLGQEDIIECMSGAEKRKEVDEVDLIVVYETTKPQENCKRRRETNMPGDEDPKARKIKIVESASCSGENKEAPSMDINSSTRGQCTGKTEQCKLYPLQSFSRHSATNEKYLGKKSHRAVDVSRGAMGSLLDKLGKLVTEDYSLDPSIKSDIESFSSELEIMHQDLPKLENIDNAKIWVDKVRELSYYIEDMVDTFLVHVELDSSRCGFRELTCKGLKLLVNGMTTHDHTDDVIKDIKVKVKAVADGKGKYNIDVNNVVANAIEKAAIYPRMAVYTNKEHLIGIETPRDDVIGLFEEGGDVDKQELRIVSIVGMGGLGKTTLAKAVYEEFKGYSHKAFVSVGQNPDLVNVLKKTIRDCQGREYNAAKLEQLDVEQLCNELRNFLKDKRYFIVIDDLWGCPLWDTINSAFPRDKCGSRVITTTRIQEVVDRESWNVENKVYRIKPLSHKDSRSLFFRRISDPRKDCPVTPRKEEILADILRRCGGMPLAINSIASHLARHSSESSWEHVRKSLGATQCNDVEQMKKILDLSYIHLPDHLKTCLLYVCMYSEDRKINKNDLLRQWVAEGFVSTDGGQDAEDVAEEYFKALIDMFMIQPWKIDYCTNEVLSCRVHDIILELMRSKSSEEKFIHVIDGLKDVSGQIHRVSVQYNDKEDSRTLKTIKGSLSHARSVLLYRASLLPAFLEFKHVRVLHLEDKVYSREPLDLTGISSLFFLRYLKIALHPLSGDLKLPDQLGQLQQLETIHLKGGGLKKYPSDLCTLPRLSCLIYSRYGGIMLPYGIERLKSLHILKGVCLYKSSVETIKGLGELTNLRNLGINSNFPIGWGFHESEEVAYARMNALHSSISSLSTSVRILTLHAYLPGHDMEYWNRTLFPQGSHIRKLHLSGCSFYTCPEWIGQLHDLYSLTITVMEVADSISIVEGLTSLAYFELSTDTDRYWKEKESIVISGGGAFQALKHLIFHCPKVSLIFEVGALPKLEKLEILFCHLTHHISYLAVGIEHLPAPTLEQIIIKLTRNIKSGFSITINDWDDNDWECDYASDQETDSLIKQLRKLRSVLKRAFKKHHPGADIYIEFEDYSYDPSQQKERYRSDEEAESVDDEDDEGAHQVNGSQTAAQVQTNTRQLIELIDAQEDSARMSINIDAPLMVGTSIDLAVGLEGWQGGRGSQDLAVLESSEQPSTSLLAPLPSSIPLFAWADTAEPMANFSVDININNDLLVQQGNDGMLVNTVGQYLDLNQQAHARELFDLNHASSADSESLQLPFRSLLAPSSSSLHHTLELSLWPDAAETERDYLNPAPNEITDEEFFVD
ncbi:disease resistance protein RGA5 isoform X2 [Triticum aestivum]|nr:disease resistance protein RGA5-like isoform X2 [Triticum aestivum]